MAKITPELGFAGEHYTTVGASKATALCIPFGEQRLWVVRWSPPTEEGYNIFGPSPRFYNSLIKGVEVDVLTLKCILHDMIEEANG